MTAPRERREVIMMASATEFLSYIKEYYSNRLHAAESKGLNQPESEYGWLYDELTVRVETIEQTELFLRLLTRYIRCCDTENAMVFATTYIQAWFQEKSVGRLPCDAEGYCCYFSEGCPYWEDIQAAGVRVDGCGSEADALRCISEYVICCLRLVFYMREHQFKAIDGSKFERLMGLADSRPSAED